MGGGATFGLAGESGCGETVMAGSPTGLIPMPPGEIASGRVIFAGEGWLRKTRREMRAVRDKRTPIARSLAVGLELVSARDLSLIRRISDRPAVVCVGTLVETGTLKQILHAP